MSTFRMAPELEARAKKIITKDHRHLREIPIVYVWRAKATHSGGSLILGKAGRITGRTAVLLASAIDGKGEIYDAELNEDDDHHRFIIEIAEDTWLLMESDERDALLDHELEHCKIDDEGRLTLRAHDVSEFASIVRRHGLWRDDLRTFGEAVEAQLSLDVDG